MSGSPVPFGHGYAEIPLGRSEGKPIKSIHVYQLEEALNIDLEFEDKSMLEMIFRIGVPRFCEVARKQRRRLPRPPEDQAQAPAHSARVEVFLL